MKVLERLVPPLILCSAKNPINHDEDRGGEFKLRSKKKKGSAESDENEKDVSGDENNGQSDDESSNIQYHKQLQNELKQQIQQNELLMKRRSNVFKSMVALHELYETGLDGISRMNDLRFVPDNVMPDEIPR